MKRSFLVLERHVGDVWRRTHDRGDLLLIRVVLLAALIAPKWDAVAVGAELEQPAYRAWTLANGKTLSGERVLIGFKDGTAIFKDGSGEIAAGHFSEFAPDDQEYIHARFDPGRDLPPEMRKRLKAATVLIWDTYESLGYGKPTVGFLVHRDGRTGLVVTDSMAITVPSGHAPGKLTVVFHSGTAGERTVTATTVAPRRNIANTNVLLRVESDELPEPIDIVHHVSPYNTMAVYVSGFAFRPPQQFARPIHPQVLVHETAVPVWPVTRINRVCPGDITLRYNNFILGSPVVDVEGRFVGLVSNHIKPDLTPVAEVKPAADLQELVRGNIDTFAGSPWRPLRADETSVTYFAFAKLIDPKNAVRSATLLSVPPEYPLDTIEPTYDGSWEPLLGNVVETPLMIKGGYVCGSLSIPRGEKRYLQMKFVEGEGELHYLEPKFTLTSASWPDYELMNGGTSLGIDQWEEPIDDSALPRPVEVDQTLAGERRRVGEAFVTPVRLPAADIAGQMQWSGDGQWLYVLQKDGLLRKIRVPEFREVLQRATLPQKKIELTRSQEGLVVVMSDATNHLWVIDEQTLEVKRRIRVRGATHAACSLVRSGAVITGADENEYLVDVKTGLVREHVKASTLREQWLLSERSSPFPPPEEFHCGTLTPDGRYYFFAHDDTLSRCRFDGRRLFFEEAGPRLGSGIQAISVSADSKLVGVACQPGGSLVSHRPEFMNACVIYTCEDLQSPKLVVPTGGRPVLRIFDPAAPGKVRMSHEGSPRVLAFDPATGRIYTHNDTSPLLVFSAAGQKELDLQLAPPDDRPRELLVHPSGGQLLVRTAKSLLWVELPRR